MSRAGGPGAGRRGAAVRAVVLALLYGASGYAGDVRTELRGRAMGTVWTARLEGLPAGGAAEARRRIEARLEEVEAALSTYRSGSALVRFNASPGTDWWPVPRDLARVAAESRAASGVTEGAYDATVGPLVRLWGFGPEGPGSRWPADGEITAARDRVGWRRLEVRAEPPALRKVRADVEADFSSLGKGYAAEEVARELAEWGVRAFLFGVAGDLKTRGDAESGRGWKLGVERAGSDGELAATVRLRGGAALSTSGNYRNVVRRDGVEVGHIVDPRTGRPAHSALRAVSVVHASSAWASALATGLLVLGPEAGPALAEAQGLAVLFQIREGGAWRDVASKAWRAMAEPDEAGGADAQPRKRADQDGSAGGRGR